MKSLRPYGYNTCFVHNRPVIEDAAIPGSEMTTPVTDPGQLICLV